MGTVKPFIEHVERYENWFEKNEAVYLSELEAVKKLVRKKDKGLEIGVGTGRFARPLGIDLGVDPSEKMLEICRQRGITTKVGTGEALPVDDEVFDFALVVTTICFFENPEQSLAEAHRVIKKKGYIVVGFVDRESPLGRTYLEKKDQSVFYKGATFFSVPEVTDLLTNAGFGNFEFLQTVFGDMKSITETQEPEKGYGKGSFVVIKGVKP